MAIRPEHLTTDPAATAAWDREIDDFAARVERIETALADGDWDGLPAWQPPVHLETSRPSPEQAVRLRDLFQRADAARGALRVALAEVGNAMGSARTHRQAARSYVRADVTR